MGTDMNKEGTSTAPLSSNEVIKAAVLKGAKGGTSGAAAMAIQVSTLMWMRTTMNYQYRYGTTTTVAMK